jgi:hypothetical protein
MFTVSTSYAYYRSQCNCIVITIQSAEFVFYAHKLQMSTTVVDGSLNFHRNRIINRLQTCPILRRLADGRFIGKISNISHFDNRTY